LEKSDFLFPTYDILQQKFECFGRNYTNDIIDLLRNICNISNVLILYDALLCNEYISPLKNLGCSVLATMQAKELSLNINGDYIPYGALTYCFVCAAKAGCNPTFTAMSTEIEAKMKSLGRTVLTVQSKTTEFSF